MDRVLAAVESLGGMSNAVSLIIALLALIVSFSAYRRTVKNEYPNVIVLVEPSPKERLACHFVVRNIGGEPARDVRIEGVDDLIRDNGMSEKFVETPIPFLEPGGERRAFIGLFPDLCSKYADRAFVAVVSFRRLGMTPLRRLDTKCGIDFRSFNDSVWDESRLEKEVARIANAMEVRKTEDKLRAMLRGSESPHEPDGGEREGAAK